MALRPRDANEDRAFMREVEEEARREAVAEGVKRYGLAIGLGVLALLLVAGGVLWWRHEQAVARAELAESYVTTLDDVEAGQTVNLAERVQPLIESSDEGYRAIGRLLLAANAVERGDRKAAALGFSQVANDRSVGEPLRQIALIRQTALEYEDLTPAEVERRLAPLAKPGAPYFGSAGELIAHARIKAGRTADAADLLAKIATDTTVPPPLRSRATQLAGSMGVDAVADNLGDDTTDPQ